MTQDSTELSLAMIRSSLEQGVAAFRMRARLQPAGGSGDKVFPPTYAAGQDGRTHETKYATEMRVVDGERKPAVLLDSVASQANRMEQLLLEAARRDEIKLPLISVDFSSKFSDLGKISALDAPHRAYDAILRDATLDGEAFRASRIGRSLTESRPSDARDMLKHCPTALLFGAWDSTGPLGGMGSKFQRALVSEVIGIDFEAGSSVGSRIDPLQVSASVRLKIPKDNSDAWEVDLSGKEKGRPSEVNHSNIAPNRIAEAGGVTFDHALNTVVLSLAALRRLRFGAWSESQQQEARTFLTALGILAMLLQRRDGYDFRSRCSLVPESPADLELVRGDGTIELLAVSVEQAFELYHEAIEAAKTASVELEMDELVLEPMPKLLQLVEASRELLAAGKDQA